MTAAIPRGRNARGRNARGQGERLRRELLDAAAELMAAPRPVEAPPLRAVARTAGVAPSAVYLHFGSGQELAEAVVADLFADLRAAIDADDDPTADPRQRVHLVAGALSAWAHRRPGAYQVLFEAADVGPLAGQRPGPGLDLLERVRDLLLLAGHDPAAAGLLVPRVWAALHGLVSLRLHKPDAPWAADLDTDIRAVLDALLTG